MFAPMPWGLITLTAAFHWVIEFLKVTFFMGVVFIPALGFMRRKKPYSLPWILAAVVCLGVLILYGNLLINLPDRVQTRSIVAEGGALVAEGKYDAAIEEYRKLEKLGKSQDMEAYLATANREKQAAQDLEQARQLLSAGKKQEAVEVLKGIPADTRAGRGVPDLKAAYNLQ